MGRQLNGAELADFIKERQLKQVRNLRQEHKIIPKLVVLKCDNASSVIDTYVRMKRRYGDDTLIETEVLSIVQSEMIAEIKRINHDESVHGCIVQLPLDDIEQTDEIVNQITPEKDVDGLGEKADYVSATAEAIDWLLAGYNVDLNNKKIVILGRGRLVGQPLEMLWTERKLKVTALDKTAKNIAKNVSKADVIVTATGVPRLLPSELIAKNAVVVDAGTTSEDGVIVGDIAPEVRTRVDLTITPEKGGVGPLTIALLYDHVIRAALKIAKS